MAMNVHLYLTEDGKQIEGEGFERSGGPDDRENTIECVEVAEWFTRPLNPSEICTIGIKKPIDKSTPVLFEHLKLGLLEAEFRFFRPSPAGDGSVEHYLTVTGRRGRVVTWALRVGKDEYTLGSEVYGGPSKADTEGGAHEFVAFVFEAVETEYTKGGIIGEIEFKAEKK